MVPDAWVRKAGSTAWAMPAALAGGHAHCIRGSATIQSVGRARVGRSLRLARHIGRRCAARAGQMPWDRRTVIPTIAAQGSQGAARRLITILDRNQSSGLLSLPAARFLWQSRRETPQSRE